MVSDKKMFATRIEKDTIRRLKILSANQAKPVNTLLEEAIQDLLTKYGAVESTPPEKAASHQ